MLWLVLAYLVGALPIGYAVARTMGKDIRSRGSGNIGATNVLRSLGRGPAVVTLLGDIVKGYGGAWVGGHAGPEAHWEALGALLVVVGNCWPVFLGFQGGKGVATGLGAFLHASPWAIVPGAVVWIVLVASFRFVSLASLCAVLGLPLAVWAFGYPLPTVGAAVAVGALVIWRHRQNIKRLLRGTESRFGERVATAAGPSPGEPRAR